MLALQHAIDRRIFGYTEAHRGRSQSGPLPRRAHSAQEPSAPQSRTSTSTARTGRTWRASCASCRASTSAPRTRPAGSSTSTAATDYLERLRTERPGDVVIVAGRNDTKMMSIHRLHADGFLVLGRQAVADQRGRARHAARDHGDAAAGDGHHDRAPRDREPGAEGARRSSPTCSVSSALAATSRRSRSRASTICTRSSTRSRSCVPPGISTSPRRAKGITDVTTHLATSRSG